MSDIFTKAKRGLTKAAHKAAAASSVETFLDDFPAIPALDGLSEVSIKILDLSSLENAIRQYVFGKNTDFQPVKFQIRDELHAKQSILAAQVVPERGFVLHDLKSPSHELMVVTLPTQSPSIVGKLQHPSGATLYKICNTSSAEKWTVQKSSGDKRNFANRNLEVIQEVKMQLQTLKSAQFVFDDKVFKLREAGGTKSLVKIRPKAKSSSHTYLVQFTDACTDSQTRILGLGLGLLMTMTVAYKELHNILKDSISEQ